MRLIATLLATALALSADQAASGRAQLLPAGKFAARDGRPGPGKHWTITDAAGAKLADALSAIAAKTPISIDYEHQSILAATNGQPAPAAGWMVGFEWQPGAGLFAKVNWTARALGLIQADEYRYISPVILYDAQGNVTGLHNAALVSTPAIVGMDAVQAALAAAFPESVPRQTARQPAHQPVTKESTVDLIILATMLGLAATANVQDVTAALQALIARPALPATLCAQLGLQTNADETAALAALTKKLGTPDAATLAAMQAMQAQVVALSAKVNDRAVAEVVDAAIAADKLNPGMRDWALNLGRNDLAALNAYVAAAMPIPGLRGQVKGRELDPASKTDTLTPTQALLAARMGLDPKAYLAQLNLQLVA